MDDRSVRTLVGRLPPLWVVHHGGGRETTPGGLAWQWHSCGGNGLGLIGMRERVMALGGQLDVIDLVDKGFRLHAMIPFEAPVGLLQ